VAEEDRAAASGPRAVDSYGALLDRVDEQIEKQQRQIGEMAENGPRPKSLATTPGFLFS
jgi:hypothetical protein